MKFHKGVVACMVCVMVGLPLAAFAADVDLLASNPIGNKIQRYDGMTGAFIGDFIPAGRGGLSYPNQMTIGPDGNLYVVSYQNHSVLRYNAKTGEFIDVFVPSRSGGLEGPYDLLFGPDGHLYVTSGRTTPSPHGSEGILKYDGRTGMFLGVFASLTQFASSIPSCMLFKPDGNMLVGILPYTEAVVEIDGRTGMVIRNFTSGAGFDNVTDIVFDANGHLLVAANASGSVLRYNGQTGEFMNTFISPGSGGLGRPWGISFGPDGNFYISDEQFRQVRRYNGVTGSFINVFGDAGQSLTDGGYFMFASFAVEDQTPPSIGNLQVSPQSLWPPNHMMAGVTVSATVSDDQDPAPTFKIVGVTSSEPGEGLGDGDQPVDILITGDLTADLRAERSGKGSGRTYTIVLEASDASGNTAQTQAIVSVPKSQGK